MNHPFEHLAPGPYRVAGYEKRVYRACPDSAFPSPQQPGGSCDHCGQSLVHCYLIEGSDGTRFTVGSDCVAKVDRGLADDLKALRASLRARARSERARVAREAKEAERARSVAAKRAWAEEHAALDLAVLRWLAGHGCKFGKTIASEFEASVLAGWELTDAQRNLVVRLASEAWLTVSRPAGRHVGAVGDRVVLTMDVVSVLRVDGRFGVSRLIVGVTPEGHRVKTFNSGHTFQPVAGDRVRVKATVKRHEEREGRAETLVTRMSLEAR